jgi:DNA-binding response OmpR family regulator
VGMDDYISKPFQIDILIEKMKTLLSKSATV